MSIEAWIYLATALATLLGGYVTIRPPDKTPCKVLIIVGFLVLGGLGVWLVNIQAKTAEETQGKLNGEIKKLREEHQEQSKQTKEALKGPLSVQIAPAKPDIAKLCFNQRLDWKAKLDRSPNKQATLTEYIYRKIVTVTSRVPLAAPVRLRIYMEGYGVGYAESEQARPDDFALGGEYVEMKVRSPITSTNITKVTLYATRPFEILCVDKLP